MEYRFSELKSRARCLHEDGGVRLRDPHAGLR